MQVKLTTESEARFKRTLRAVARETNKSLLDLLRQAAVFYIQSARKGTPGPWYGSTRKTLKARPFTEIPQDQARRLREAGKPFPRGVVELFRGTQPAKVRALVPVASEKARIRDIPRRGAAQVSWSGMMKKLFPARGDVRGGGDLRKVYLAGSLVTTTGAVGSIAAIETENRLPYISKIAPGLVRDSMRSAENRFQAVWSKKLGDVVKKEWR